MAPQPPEFTILIFFGLLYSGLTTDPYSCGSCLNCQSTAETLPEVDYRSVSLLNNMHKYQAAVEPYINMPSVATNVGSCKPVTENFNSLSPAITENFWQQCPLPEYLKVEKSLATPLHYSSAQLPFYLKVDSEPSCCDILDKISKFLENLPNSGLTQSSDQILLLQLAPLIQQLTQALGSILPSLSLSLPDGSSGKDLLSLKLGPLLTQLSTTLGSILPSLSVSLSDGSSGKDLLSLKLGPLLMQLLNSLGSILPLLSPSTSNVPPAPSMPCIPSISDSPDDDNSNDILSLKLAPLLKQLGNVLGSILPSVSVSLPGDSPSPSALPGTSPLPLVPGLLGDSGDSSSNDILSLKLAPLLKQLGDVLGSILPSVSVSLPGDSPSSSALPAPSSLPFAPGLLGDSGDSSSNDILSLKLAPLLKQLGDVLGSILPSVSVSLPGDSPSSSALPAPSPLPLLPGLLGGSGDSNDLLSLKLAPLLKQILQSLGLILPSVSASLPGASPVLIPPPSIPPVMPKPVPCLPISPTLFGSPVAPTPSSNDIISLQLAPLLKDILQKLGSIAPSVSASLPSVTSAPSPSSLPSLSSTGSNLPPLSSSSAPSLLSSAPTASRLFRSSLSTSLPSKHKAPASSTLTKTSSKPTACSLTSNLEPMNCQDLCSNSNLSAAQLVSPDTSSTADEPQAKSSQSSALSCVPQLELNDKVKTEKFVQPQLHSYTYEVKIPIK